LSQLAVESDHCRELVHSISLGPFLDSIERKPMGIKFTTTPYKDNDLFFWKIVLREALHSASLGMFSDKAIESFLKRIQVTKPKEGWLQCRKDYAVYLREDGTVFVLYPTSFPWSKADQFSHFTSGQTVTCPSEAPFHVGPWSIRVEEVGHSADVPSDWESLLGQKAIESMDHLLDGSFSYHLCVPVQKDGLGTDLPSLPLVFRKYKKADRPRAWKGVDMKIQETLPILGCDDSSETTNKDQGGNNHFLLVKILSRI